MKTRGTKRAAQWPQDASPLRRESTWSSAEVLSRRSTVTARKELRSGHDCIHGSIEKAGLEQRIIQTPEFQRLRNLDQLGVTHYVYNNATHSRLEHSIGVMHLAGALLDALLKNNTDLGLVVTERDRLCVRIAALCHDLGHGPYSHVYDEVIVPEVFPGKMVPVLPSPTDPNAPSQLLWSHEAASLRLFDLLLERNEIDVRRYGLDPDEDIPFIKDLIKPHADPQQRLGRRSADGRVDPRRLFLYDIVCNETSGLDVDKMDYIKRDANRVGLPEFEHYDRLFQTARVCDVTKNSFTYTEIHYRDKLAPYLLRFFRTRFDLHAQVYQHNKVKAIEFMLRDALLTTLPGPGERPPIRVFGTKIPGTRFADGRYSIAEAVHDMAAYSMLDDSILGEIRRSADPRLARAQQLLRRIPGDIYRCVAELHCPRDIPLAVYSGIDGQRHEDVKEAIVKAYYARQECSEMSSHGISEDANEDASSQDTEPDGNAEPGTDGRTGDHAEVAAKDGELEASDLILLKKYMHWGAKGSNPIAKIGFYAKDGGVQRIQLREEDFDGTLPAKFERRQLVLFIRNGGGNKEAKARMAFQWWADDVRKAQNAA